MHEYAKFMNDLVSKNRFVSFEKDERLKHCGFITIRSIVHEKEDMEL